MASPTVANDSGGPTTASLYDAIERLREDAADIFSVLEGSGDYLDLRDRLGSLRDRADAIQSAVMGHIDAINTHL